MRGKLLRAAAFMAVALCVFGSAVHAGEIPYAGGTGGAGGAGSVDGAAMGALGGKGGAADDNGDTTADSTAATPSAGSATELAGGDATDGESIVDAKIAFPTTDTLSLIGGAGGAGGAATATQANGGAGGAGGSISATLTGAAMTTATKLTGGAGGAAGTFGDAAAPGGAGGKGGDVSVTYAGKALTIDAALALTAGAAGDLNSNAANINGNGGSVSFQADAADVVLGDGAAGSIVLVGAAKAAQGEGVAGEVDFHAKSLNAGANGGTFTAATAAAGDSRFHVQVGAINAVDGNMTVDLSGLDTDPDTGNARSSIGKITIGDGTNARTFTATTALGATQGWNGDLRVVGANTIATSALDLTGTEANKAAFVFTGVANGGTVATGTITVDGDTTIEIEKATANHLGGAGVTLATGGAAALATDTIATSSSIADSANNTATLGGYASNATGALKWFGKNFNAAGNWVLNEDTAVASSATDGVSFVVGGELTLGTPDPLTNANLTFTRTANDLLADIGALRIAKGTTSTVTFTNTEGDLNDATDTNKAVIGKIVMDADSTLTVAGTQNTDFAWIGSFASTDNVTLDGGTALDFSGKTIDSTLTDDFDLAADTILTGTAGTTFSDETLVNVSMDAAKAAELDANGARLNIFNSATMTNAANVEEEDITVKSGLFTFEGDYDTDTGVLSNAERVLKAADNEVGHTALLAAPAAMALLNSGADVVENVTGSFSPMALGGNYASTVQVGAFAALSAGSVEVDTGSDVDSDSFHLLVGPGLRINAGSGKVDFGAFFEAGWGSYDAFNGVQRGEGDTDYFGGGLLARFDSCNGFYAEGSLRFGNADSDFQSGTSNQFGAFDIDGGYFGGHLGLGYIFSAGQNATFDIFGKGLLTKMDGDSTRDISGYTLDIDDTTSLRSQVGAKYSYNFGGNASFFVKAAWEHEFDGETAARYSGPGIAVAIRESDTGGSSVIGELGVNVRLAERAFLEASVYGMAGRRQGFGGTVNVGFGF